MINQSKGNIILLAILWPFAGLVSSLKNWRQPWAMNVFWVVCIFMGAIQIYQPNGQVLGTGADGGRYVLLLQYMHRNVTSFSEVSEDFFDGHTNDAFADTLIFLISRVTENGHIFFLVLAVIFGFFYSRNIWYILKFIPETVTRYFWVLIAALFLVCPIWEINGVRMWTALHMYVYGALPFLLEGDRKKLIWCLASLLVHHSFLLPILIIVAFVFIPKRFIHKPSFQTALFIVYIISLTVKTLELTVLNGYLHQFLPIYYEGRIDSYVSEETLENRLEVAAKLSPHVVFFEKFRYYVVQILIIFAFWLFRKNEDTDSGIVRLFIFALSFCAIANVFSCVPSGGRYIHVAAIFMLSAIMFIVCYCNFEGSFFQRYFPVLMLCLGISLLFDIRGGMSYYGYNLVFGNYITALFLDTDVPIIDFIKQLL